MLPGVEKSVSIARRGAALRGFCFLPSRKTFFYCGDADIGEKNKNRSFPLILAGSYFDLFSGRSFGSGGDALVAIPKIWRVGWWDPFARPAIGAIQLFLGLSASKGRRESRRGNSVFHVSDRRGSARGSGAPRCSSC